jgi:RNA polymerase-binding protein DksA
LTRAPQDKVTQYVTFWAALHRIEFDVSTKDVRNKQSGSIPFKRLFSNLISLLHSSSGEKGWAEMKTTNATKTTRRAVSHRSLLRYFDQEAQRLQRAIQIQQELIKQPGETRGELFEEASEITEQAQNIAVLEQLNKELAQIQTARKRLEEGRYGICQKCGQPIPRERLRVRPYATLCVRCQALSGSDKEPPPREFRLRGAARGRTFHR